MSSKTVKEVLEQQYVTAYDMQIINPKLTYQNALDYIKRIRKIMVDKNLFCPPGKSNLALTWLVKKDLGIK